MTAQEKSTLTMPRAMCSCSGKPSSGFARISTTPIASRLARQANRSSESRSPRFESSRSANRAVSVGSSGQSLIRAQIR